MACIFGDGHLSKAIMSVAVLQVLAAVRNSDVRLCLPAGIGRKTEERT
jgi:hypothetical protein